MKKDGQTSKAEKVKLKDKIKSKVDAKYGKYKWYQSFTGDYGFRTLVLCVGGALLNIVFACFNGATAIKYSSVWFGAFAGYYTMLAVQRLFVLFSCHIVKKKCSDDEQKLEREKQKIYLANGAIFVPLDIALGVVVTYMVIMQKPTATGEIMAITTATYTCYKVIMAIRNVFKAKSTNDAVIQTIRNIGIVDALASVLSLETTLIPTFGELNKDMIIIIAISGLVVCLFTVALGAFMIINGAKKLKSTQEIKNE